MFTTLCYNWVKAFCKFVATKCRRAKKEKTEGIKPAQPSTKVDAIMTDVYKIIDNRKALAEIGITPDHQRFPEMYTFQLKPVGRFVNSLEELN